MQLVTRFWFEFDLSGDKLYRFPRFPAYGIGVTAYDYHDALHLMRKWVTEFEEMPEIINVIEDVDISQLREQMDKYSQIGCPVWRGVWHPAINLWFGPDIFGRTVIRKSSDTPAVDYL